MFQKQAERKIEHLGPDPSPS